MYPKNIQAALEKYPGSVVTERGLELTHPNGTVELLVSVRNLLEPQGLPKAEVKEEAPAEEVKPKAKPGPKPKVKVEE